MSVQIDAIKPGDSVLVRMRITEAGERGIFAQPASSVLSASAVHLWPEDIFSVEKAPLKVETISEQAAAASDERKAITEMLQRFAAVVSSGRIEIAHIGAGIAIVAADGTTVIFLPSRSEQ